MTYMRVKKVKLSYSHIRLGLNTQNWEISLKDCRAIVLFF
jgi:hypothetical protein